MRRFTVTALGPENPFASPPLHEAVSQMKQHWDMHLDSVLPDHPDLIVLPECCDRFSLMTADDRKKYYAERGDAFVDYFSRKAADNNCMIAYSAVRQTAEGIFRNVTTLLDREGKEAASYYKYYPVIEEKTVSHIQEGTSPCVVETEFGRIGFAICFDLNFMDLLEQYAQKKPHLMLFSSMYHGGHVQSHWAYTCRSYFAGSIPHHGQCTILNPLGIEIASSTNYYPFVTSSINTDFEVVHLDYNRLKILAARKKYGPAINVYDPGYLGCVLISSETPELTASQVVEEFEIERLDEYWARVRRFYGRDQLI